MKVREEGPCRSTWPSPGKARLRREYIQPRPTPLVPEVLLVAGHAEALVLVVHA